MVHRIVRLILIAVIMTPTVMIARLWAQDSEWSTPKSISSVLEGPSQFPKIAADAAGQLHVVWVENSYADRGVADAIYYSRYDGANWSAPVDILVAPDQGSISMGEFVVLPNGDLSLLWIGADALRLSTVHPEFADIPNGWMTTTLLPGATAFKTFMLVLPDGRLALTFVEQPSYSVMFAQSPDLGSTWSEPVTVWEPGTDELAADDVRLCSNPDGTQLHLVWHVNAAQFNWNPYGVWYSRAIEGGASWAPPEELINRGSSPNCAYDGSGILHMIWNNAVGSIDGRYHRSSVDDGNSWTEAMPIFPGLSGRTRAPAFAVDSMGVLHVLTGAASEGKTQMFASRWEGSNWAAPQSISGELPSNESPDLVVTSGNRLNAVWHFGDDTSLQVWFSQRQTEAPSSPTIAATQDQSNQATATPTDFDSTAAISVATTAQAAITRPLISTEPVRTSSISSIALSSVMGLLVVVAVVGVALAKRDR
jgi:hypothetical protein